MKEHELSERETATQRVATDIVTGLEVVNVLAKPTQRVMGEIFARHVGWPLYRRAMRFLSR